MISKPRRSARAVADEQRADLDRLVQPLVRVERDRVRELDPGERLAAALGEAGERAVGAVDVQPHALLAADLRQLGERVHRAGSRRAGVGDDHQRRAARRRSAAIALAARRAASAPAGRSG